MVTGAVWANKLFMNTSTSELKSAIEFLNVTGLERSSSDYPYSGRTANGEWGMEHCCLLSKQIIEKIVPFPRPPAAAAVVPSTKCPKNRTSERRFLPPSLLSSCPTHLTRSSPTMNDGVNCINFPLQKSALDSAPLSGLLLARRSNFASKAETRSAVSVSKIQ